MIEVLNRYLSMMSDIILDHGGTLVSYMGDGIMAVFGAPLEHSTRGPGVGGGAAMGLDALAEVNDWIRAEGLVTGSGWALASTPVPLCQAMLAPSGGWSTRRSETPSTRRLAWSR